MRRAPDLVTSEAASVHLLGSYLRVVIASWDEVRTGRWRLALAVGHLDALVQKALDVKDEKTEAGGISAAELTWRVLFSLVVRELRLEGADQTASAASTALFLTKSRSLLTVKARSA